MTRKYWGPTTQPTTPNQPLVNQLEVLEPSLGLDLIDSQSSSPCNLSSQFDWCNGSHRPSCGGWDSEYLNILTGAGIEVKPGLIMNYHSPVTSHQRERYTTLHVTRRHVMLQRRHKTVKWRLTKTKESWLNINNRDVETWLFYKSKANSK